MGFTSNHSQAAACRLLIGILLFLFPIAAGADETAILAIHLNQQPKGEFFVQLTDDGDIWLLSSDLQSLELKLPPGPEISFQGEIYRSVRSLPGIRYELDPATLVLQLTADPALLPENAVDLAVKRKPHVYYPLDQSAFFNYGIDWSGGSEESDRAVIVSSEIGIRKKDFLFETDTLFTSRPDESRFVRLNTSLSREDRASLVRWTVGDFSSQPGEFSDPLQIGGFQYSKRYRIDPYRLKYPTLNFAGTASLPSELEIYLDGARIYAERISPGPFELQNISRYRGAGLLEVVLRDPFGNEERIRNPFYLSDVLLKAGLHEYSYSLGMKRNGYGSESFDYGDAVGNAVHAVGLDDDLTVGGEAELGPGVFNLGPKAVYRVSRWGIVDGALSGHLGDEGFGYAGSLGYQYFNRYRGGQLRIRHFSDSYRTNTTVDSIARPQFEFFAGVSYAHRDFGSVSLNWVAESEYEGENQSTVSLNYSRSFLRNFSVTAFLRKSSGRLDETLVSFNLNYYPRVKLLASARVEQSDKTSIQSVQLQSNPPSGEGYGYRILAEHAKTDDENRTTLNPYGEYRSRYGIYRAELWGDHEDSGNHLRYRFSAAGALAYLGRTFAPTRPIRDSFALVKVGDVGGVRVYRNSEEIGRTDADGKIFIPDLNSYFENQISINDKDIPIDHTIPAVNYYLIPPLRSGSCLNFEAKKFQPIVGRLQIAAKGETVPIEFRELRIRLGSGEVVLPTGKGGEFYFDPSEAEQGMDKQSSDPTGCDRLTEAMNDYERQLVYQADVDYNGKNYPFTLQVPLTEGLFIDLGTIVVNAQTAAEKPPSASESTP